jgi:hypothetical protein
MNDLFDDYLRDKDPIYKELKELFEKKFGRPPTEIEERKMKAFIFMKSDEKVDCQHKYGIFDWYHDNEGSQIDLFRCEKCGDVREVYSSFYDFDDYLSDC